MYFKDLNSLKSESYQRISNFLSVLLIITSPVIVLFFSLGALYRLGIQKLAKVLKPELSKCLSVRGHYFSTEKIYQTPKTKIVVQIVFEGNIDEETMRQRIINKLILAKLPDGQEVYPELQQFLTKWCGYYFWKKDPEFNISNHFRYLTQKDFNKESNALVSDEDILHFCAKILNQGFPQNRPLWEIVAIPNHNPSNAKITGPHTTFLLFMHHTLGDGYSILRLIRTQLFHNPAKNVILPVVKQPKNVYGLTNIKHACLYPMKFVQVISEILCMPLVSSPFAVQDENQSGKCHHRISQKISLDVIKTIKDHFKISFSSVIIAISGLCLRDHLKRKGAKIPNTVILATAYPTTGHSSKLRNKFRGIAIRLPMWAISEEYAVTDCHKQFEANREITPLAADVFCMALYSLPNPLQKFLGKNRGMSVTLSNFSFGQNSFYFDENQKNKCSEVFFNLGVGFGVAGLGIRISTYEDGLRVAVAVDVAVMTPEEADAFIRSFENQIQNLCSLTA